MTEQTNELALQFQDQVYSYFKEEWKWHISHHTSLKKQFELGENVQGIEIKHDQKFCKTGNIFISVKRTYPYQEDKTSGIMKEHNKRFFVIGDKHKFYIFSLQKLRRYYENTNPILLKGFLSEKNGREWGFLLSEAVADEMAFEIYSNQLELEV
jgi:hypothetical protein